ncbi:DUF6234 family protein [Streptomyces noursei]|uniref:DUF6234 family protein n=1 Tax=Streptomyces noursei TaxID=1971 RepID=UPI00069E3983|nr:DUF6234 family protein [Streptomyces noursei]
MPSSWVVDTGLAFVLVLLDVAALVAFWFRESFKQWAVQGNRVEGAALRLWLVLTLGSVGLVTISYEAVRIGLVVTGLSQALIGAALTGVLILGLGTEFSRWLARSSARRRSRRRRIDGE